jgi:ribosomal protein L34
MFSVVISVGAPRHRSCLPCRPRVREASWGPGRWLVVYRKALQQKGFTPSGSLPPWTHTDTDRTVRKAVSGFRVRLLSVEGPDVIQPKIRKSRCRRNCHF